MYTKTRIQKEFLQLSAMWIGMCRGDRWVNQLNNAIATSLEYQNYVNFISTELTTPTTHLNYVDILKI